MTTARLAHAQPLVSGAHEPRAPHHPGVDPASAASVVLAEGPRSPAQPESADVTTPTTRRVPRSLAVLGDVALAVAVIFAVALAPAIAVNAIAVAVRLVLGMFD